MELCQIPFLFPLPLGSILPILRSPVNLMFDKSQHILPLHIYLSDYLLIKYKIVHPPLKKISLRPHAPPPSHNRSPPRRYFQVIGKG